MSHAVGPVVKGICEQKQTGDMNAPDWSFQKSKRPQQGEHVKSVEQQMKPHRRQRARAKNSHPSEKRQLIKRRISGKDLFAGNRERQCKGGIGVFVVQ
jgi:hypothetical protein